MKISDPHGIAVSGLGQSSAMVPANASGRSAPAARQSSASDQVQLSNLSEHLSAAVADSAGRMKKLSSLAAAVLSGGYHVDAGAVSESIIRYSLQFGGGNYL